MHRRVQRRKLLTLLALFSAILTVSLVSPLAGHAQGAKAPKAAGPAEPVDLNRADADELTAELDALGKSLIRETAYPGVWWVEHRNAADEIVGRFLEITRTPEILLSQDADIAAGRARLEDQFE